MSYLVVEALGVLVDDDANTTESWRVMMPAVEFRRTGVDRHPWHCVGSPTSCTALCQQHLQGSSRGYTACAGSEILVGGLAPIFFSTIRYWLRTRRRRDQRGGADFALWHPAAGFSWRRGTCRRRSGGRYFGIVEESRRRVFSAVRIKRVQPWRGPPPRKNELVRPRLERAAQRRLPAHSPARTIQFKMSWTRPIINLASSSSVWPPVMRSRSSRILLGVRTGQNPGRRVMGAAHVAGVAGVAREEFWRAFQPPARRRRRAAR